MCVAANVRAPVWRRGRRAPALPRRRPAQRGGLALGSDRGGGPGSVAARRQVIGAQEPPPPPGVGGKCKMAQRGREGLRGAPSLPARRRRCRFPGS